MTPLIPDPVITIDQEVSFIHPNNKPHNMGQGGIYSGECGCYSFEWSLILLKEGEKEVK